MLFIHEDGLLYTIENSIFSHHESIWTYNCPCPLQSGCSTRHVCRFKQHTAATTMLGKDEVIAARLTKEYQDLVQLFKQQKDVPVLLGTQYSEFKRFREKLGIHIRHKLCRYASFCNLESCVFAHSIGDMIEPFEDARICAFYKQASIVTHSEKPKEFAVQKINDIRCGTPNCLKGKKVPQVVLYDSQSCNLDYPHIMINCSECKTDTRVSIYK